MRKKVVAIVGVLAGCVSQHTALSPPIVLRPRVTGAPAANGLDGTTTTAPDVGPDVLALAQDNTNAHRAYDVARSICDEVGPRIAGGPNDAAAIAWAEQTMTAMGLAHVRKEIVRVPRWERGVESAQLVAPAQTLAVAQLGGSAPTPAAGLEGEIVRVGDVDDIEGFGEKEIRGRVVYIAKALEPDSTFESYGATVKGRVLGAIAAAKKGAIAVLVRSVGTDNTRLAHTGSVKVPEPADGVAAIPAAAIATPDADMLDRLYDIKKTLRVRLKLTGHRVADGTSANVSGELVGRDKPDEIVLLGAHLDSWDLGRGALDDGAGIGVVLAATKMIAERRAPRRSVRVVLFAAEEMSGSGAKQYAIDHQAELEKHVAALEADAGDGVPRFVRWLGSVEGEDLGARLIKNMSAVDVQGDGASAEGGTDLGPLRAAGVPVVDVVQDVSTYFDVHHTANDTFDKIDENTISAAASAFAVAAFTLAESTSTLGRVPLAKRARAWGK